MKPKLAQNGAATNILSGLALGNESSTYAALVIGVSIFASVLIFGADGFTAILYGVALTGIGMLMLTGNTISMDAFADLDNANGIAEMSNLSPNRAWCLTISTPPATPPRRLPRAWRSARR